MARIRVTAYECERDLLPPVCAKCGKPAVGRVVRPARYIKNDYRLLWIPLLVIFGLMFMPPLGVWAIVRLSHRLDVCLPMCVNHLGDYIWRDRAFLRWVLPIWTVAVLTFESLAVMDLFGYGDGAAFLLGVLIAGALAVVVDTLIGHTSVKIQAEIRPLGVYLNGAHPDFVAALVEERARSRIDDPNRRAEGDVKHDYDDELN